MIYLGEPVYKLPLTNWSTNELFFYGFGFALTFIILFILYLITNQVFKKIEQKTENYFAKRLRKNYKLPIVLLIIVCSVWLPFTFSEVPDSISIPARSILSILLIAIVAMLAIRFVNLIQYLVLKKYDIDQKDNLKARKVYTQFRIIQRVINFIIVIIAIALALMTFNEIKKIGVSLIASAGVTGIILGFAAQKVIGGVLAGVQIALTQPIRLDDVVIVEKEWGWIEEINLTYVVVKIWDQRRLVLPSTYFIEKPFQNWTRNTSEILGTVFLYTDYTVDFTALRSEVDRLLKKTDLWDKRVNVLQVTDATEKTVEVRVLVSAVDSPTAWDLRVYLREGLIIYLQEKYPESLPKSRIIFTSDNPDSVPLPKYIK